MEATTGVYTPVTTMAQLREYVMAPSEGQIRSKSTVLLSISHSNLKRKFMEIRFDLSMTIHDVKAKLYSSTGTSMSHMQLVLKDSTGAVCANLSQESAMLGSYGPRDGYIIHVIDLDPYSNSRGGWLEDTSLVKKFELTDEEYNNRNDTYRAYKKSLQKSECKEQGSCCSKAEPSIEDVAEKIKVGSRCEVTPGQKRGIVRFVGSAEGFPQGTWVGVEYDEPVGKNDGSAKGYRLFECRKNCGEFVKPDKVVCGDFPPLDDGLDDLSDDEL